MGHGHFSPLPVLEVMGSGVSHTCVCHPTASLLLVRKPKLSKLLEWPHGDQKDSQETQILKRNFPATTTPCKMHLCPWQWGWSQMIFKDPSYDSKALKFAVRHTLFSLKESCSSWVRQASWHCITLLVLSLPRVQSLIVAVTSPSLMGALCTSLGTGKSNL